MSTVTHRKPGAASGGASSAPLKATPRAENTPSSGIGAWVTFFNERVPIVVYALLACGPVFSAMTLCEKEFDLATFLWTAPAQLLFLITIRFMDDVKDFDKDCEVHPDRPLPRGLLKVSEVTNAVRYLLASLFAFAFFSHTISLPVKASHSPSRLYTSISCTLSLAAASGLRSARCSMPSPTRLPSIPAPCISSE
eukprot:Opistho-2@61540